MHNLYCSFVVVSPDGNQQADGENDGGKDGDDAKEDKFVPEILKNFAKPMELTRNFAPMGGYGVRPVQSMWDHGTEFWVNWKIAGCIPSVG